MKSGEKEKILEGTDILLNVSLGEHCWDLWDWNLKQSVVIISREPFTWINGSKADECSASLNFYLDKTSEQHHMKLHKALHRYVYPGLMLPSSVLNEIQSQNKNIVKEQLQIDWFVLIEGN